MEPIAKPSVTQVLIAGGGFAALETMLALRALAGERVQITVLCPTPRFIYRPAATAEVFDGLEQEISSSYDLRAICGDLGAQYRQDRLEAVASSKNRVRLASFATLEYDVLVLALGARAAVAVPGALTFRDGRDVKAARRMLSEVRAGSLRRLVFAVPSGCTWPLALYELALMSAGEIKKYDLDATVSLVSPSSAPLEMFGRQTIELVSHILAEKNVHFYGNSIPSNVRHDGSLALHFDGNIPADCVVATPQLRGPRISGIPTDWWGFARVDEHSRVEGLSNVYAAGDMTTFPIKHGGVATQHADRIARAIAEPQESQGADFPKLALRARLIGGEQPLMLQTALDEHGIATESKLEQSAAFQTDTSTAKVFGHYLTPYLQGIQACGAQTATAAPEPAGS